MRTNASAYTRDRDGSASSLRHVGWRVFALRGDLGHLVRSLESSSRTSHGMLQAMVGDLTAEQHCDESSWLAVAALGTPSQNPNQSTEQVA